MVTNETYKQLVIAGAKIVKDLKVIDAMDFHATDKIFESGVHLYDALKHLINVAADMSTGEDYKLYDMAQIFYADTISVYAHDEELGEKYYDALWNMNSGEDGAKEKWDEIRKSIPDDIQLWVRRHT